MTYVDCHFVHTYDKRLLFHYHQDSLAYDMNNKNDEMKNNISCSDLRPWCMNGEGTSPQWEYCDIPACKAKGKLGKF